MTKMRISSDYAQVALCVLDAIADMIDLGIPKKAVDLRDVLDASLEVARANLGHIQHARCSDEFNKGMHHIKGHLLLVENSVKAEARPSIAIAMGHYTQAIVDLLDEQHNEISYGDYSERYR